jgi:hypothetical protein
LQMGFQKRGSLRSCSTLLVKGGGNHGVPGSGNLWPPCAQYRPVIGRRAGGVVGLQRNGRATFSFLGVKPEGKKLTRGESHGGGELHGEYNLIYSG